MKVFETARLGHVAGPRTKGDAAARVITAEDFSRAAAEISSWPGYAPTPLVDLADLARSIGIGAIHYKNEGPRFGLGSFKALGAAYAALRLLQTEVSRATGQAVSLADIRDGRFKSQVAAITLVSATDGNHGRALAWGCQRFGAPCRIYIHAGVSEARAEAVRSYGATVIRTTGDYDASVGQARDEAAANGWFVVSDTSWPGYSQPPRDVMAGYGLIVAESFAQMAEAPTHAFVQCGVGGVAAAVAASLLQVWGARAPRFVVVEPERAACLFASAKTGQQTTVPIIEETMMAGLSCGAPSGMAWEILREEASDFVTIPDTLVAPTMRHLARPPGGDPVVETGESGVAGLAALIAVARQPAMRRALGITATSRVMLIGSEGVTDTAIYADAMAGADPG